MEQELKDAVQTLRKALAEDKSEGSYYYAWQANIAMAFYDEFMKQYPKAYGTLELHNIANKAAKNFLDLLLIQIK